jgi:hypothetical protein
LQLVDRKKGSGATVSGSIVALGEEIDNGIERGVFSIEKSIDVTAIIGPGSCHSGVLMSGMVGTTGLR